MDVETRTVGSVLPDGRLVMASGTRALASPRDRKAPERVLGVIQRRGKCSYSEVLRSLSHYFNTARIKPILHRLVEMGVVVESLEGRKRVFSAGPGNPPAPRTLDAKKVNHLASHLTLEQMDSQRQKPLWLAAFDLWAYRARLVKIVAKSYMREDECALHVQRHVLREEQGLDDLKEEVGFLEAERAGEVNRREKIPRHIREHVWRRDRGRCANCGRRNSLEFDHIIPLAKGGSNTVRNLQLLCADCNRKKGVRIDL